MNMDGPSRQPEDDTIRARARAIKEQLLKAATPPPRTAVVPEGIPAEMRDAGRRWCVWRWEWDARTERWTKVPRTPRGANADASRKATWATFEDAVAAYRSDTTLAGLGFFLGDGWAGVDVDGSVLPPEPETDAPAARIVSRFGHGILARFATYAEFSPSGTGYKAFFRADLTAAVEATGRKTGGKNTAADVEVYARTRFFCVTGHVVDDAHRAAAHCQQEGERFVAEFLAPAGKRTPERKEPTTGPTLYEPGPDECELLRLMFANKKNGDKIRALYDGSIAGYESPSGADAALCCHLAYWFGNDAGAIERVFDGSKLAERGKWRDRPDYRERTIANAVGLTTMRTKKWHAVARVPDQRTRQFRRAWI